MDKTVVSTSRFAVDQYLRKRTATGLLSQLLLFLNKKSRRRTDSNFDFGTLVEALQGKFDTIAFKTHHHITTYGYDRDP